MISGMISTCFLGVVTWARSFEHHSLQEVDEKEGKVTRNIQRFFGVNTALAQQYAATIFIMDNRIDVSPKKWGQ